MEKRQYICPKCGCQQYESDRLQATGGNFAKMFDIQNKKFVTISCCNCGYTELYRQTGGEGWGYETEPGTEVKPYSPDIGFKDSPDAVTGTLGGGRFVIFFPGELHRPGIAQPDCKNVHKAVVKIRMEDKHHG